MNKSKDIRSSLIGLLIKHQSTIPDVAPIMGWDDPLNGPLSEVLKAIQALYDAKEVIGASSVIRRTQKLSGMAMPIVEQMVYDCMEMGKNPNHVKAYVDEIRNSLIIDKIKRTINKVNSDASYEHANPDGLMETLEKAVNELRGSVMASEDLAARDAVDEMALDIEEYAESGETPMMKTGIFALDRMMGGFANGEYICVSALNGGGKSALATGMMLFMSKPIYHTIEGKKHYEKGPKTGFISLEMTKKALIERLIMQLTGFDLTKALARKVPADEIREKFHEGRQKMELFNLALSAPKSSKLVTIKNKVREMHSEGCKVIFIDYFQLIKGRSSDKTASLEEVSDAFRELALELNIPIVMLAQQRKEAHREGVGREFIKHCSKIAEDSHKVLLISKNKEKIIVDKNRNGEEGEIPVIFNKNGRLCFVGEGVEAPKVKGGIGG